jgi:membrane-associated protein
MFDIIGGVTWVCATILGGYFLGRTVPNISQRIHYVIIVVVIVSILPAIIGILRGRKTVAKSTAAGQ